MPLAVFLLFAPLRETGQPAATSLRPFVPDTISAAVHRIPGSLREYDEDGLYDMINGGADLVLEYDFCCAASAGYADTGGNRLRLDLYALTDGDGAYGLFSVYARGEAISGTYGEASAGGPDYFLFRKGKYVVAATAVDTAARPHLPALARDVEERIRGSAAPPPALVAVLAGALPECTMPVYGRGQLGLRRSGLRFNAGAPHPFEAAIDSAEGCSVALLRFFTDVEAAAFLEDTPERTEPPQRMRRRGSIIVSVQGGNPDSTLTRILSHLDHHPFTE